MTDITEKVASLISQLADLDDGESLDKDTKILSLGYVDSFSVLEIITFLEEEFSIRIDGELISLERFDSINLIVDLVKELQSESQ